MFNKYIILVNSLLTPPKMLDRMMKSPKTKQKSKNKTGSIYCITIVQGWLSTGSSSVSLGGKKKKNNNPYPVQLIQNNLVMKEPSVLFFSFSPHIHTALLLNAEVREGAVALKTLQGGREGKQENEEEVKKNENIQKKVRGKEAWRNYKNNWFKNVLWATFSKKF